MLKVLHIDSSARTEGSDVSPHGSHTRRLSARFVDRWSRARPDDEIVYRDVGQIPPSPVTARWIHAAFTEPALREPWMADVLTESDELVDELIAADLIVAGVPMYNFGVPAQFKAYIDNVVRVGRTFGFDRDRPDDPYSRLLADRERSMVVLTSRGDYGYDEGGRLAHANHVEPGIATPFGFLGIDDITSIAVEYDEFADDRLKASIAEAEAKIDTLADGQLSRWSDASNEKWLRCA